MNLNPRVAILLAAYNGIQWLEDQINSINKQIDVEIHVFISVDLSTDATYEWCKSLEEKSKNITVLSYGARFGGAAKNFFRLIRDVDFSDYNYIALADQDDIWLKGKLSYAITTIKRRRLEGFSSDVTAFWSDGREKYIKKSYPQKKYDYLFEAAGPGCTYVLTQRSLEQFKSFLINHWHEIEGISLHDWMIYSYYRTNNLQWHIDSTSLMLYRQHEHNQVGINFGFNATINRLGMVKNNWYSMQVSKIATLLNASEKFSFNRLELIRNFKQLRRRPRDAFVLLLMLLTGLY